MIPRKPSRRGTAVSRVSQLCYACWLLLGVVFSGKSQGTVIFTNYPSSWLTNFGVINPTNLVSVGGIFSNYSVGFFGPVISASNLQVRVWNNAQYWFSSVAANPANWLSFGPFNPTPGAPPALWLSNAVASLAVVGSPMSVNTVWNETNASISPVELWVVKHQTSGTGSTTTPPILIGSGPVLEVSSTRVIDWTPPEPGVFYIFARTTNAAGLVKESSWIPITANAPNDEFSRAAQIVPSATTFQQTFNLQWSSVEANEPMPLTGLTGQSLWWRWTPDHAGLVSLRATQDSQDQTLEVFIGSNLGKLKRIAGTPGSVIGAGGPTLAWLRVKAGQTYFLRVSRYAPVIPSFAGYSTFTLSQPNTTLNIQSFDSRKSDGPIAAGTRMVDLSFFGATRLVRGQPASEIKARVRLADGSYVTGDKYRAQLYVGTTLRNLQPVGTPQKFMASVPGSISQYAGTIMPTTVVLTGFGARQPVVAKIKVWDSAAGNNYETAMGHGLTGESSLLTIEPGEKPVCLDRLMGLRDFRLGLASPLDDAQRTADFVQAFQTPALSLTLRDGQLVGKLTSPIGSRCAIEAQIPGGTWETILILTNETGEAEFTDPRLNLPPASLYRARLME